jgi:hypothetical protein
VRVDPRPEIRPPVPPSSAHNRRNLAGIAEIADRQLSMLHDASLLVSPHGAQLTNIPFLAPGATVVEVHK